MTIYKIKAEVCAPDGTPLYWQQLGIAQPGDTVTFTVSDLAAAGVDGEYRLPDGTWCCTRDHVTEPCGDCDGCRYAASVNAGTGQ